MQSVSFDRFARSAQRVVVGSYIYDEGMVGCDDAADAVDGAIRSALLHASADICALLCSARLAALRRCTRVIAVRVPQTLTAELN